jgi:threonyl-tRNA synthetase
VWLSPIQVGIANINDNCTEYCNSTMKQLEKFNIRCKFDDRHEKLNYKIREFSLQKIPFIGVVGEKEVTNNTLNIRELGSENQYTIQIDEFIKKIKNSCRIS